MERKRMMIVGAGVGLTAMSAAQRARRAARLSAGEGLAASGAPSRPPEEPDVQGEAHAAGHRHLPAAPVVSTPVGGPRQGRIPFRNRHGARLSDRGGGDR